MCVSGRTILCTHILAAFRTGIGSALPGQQHPHSSRVDVSITLWTVSYTHRPHAYALQDSHGYVHSNGDSQRDTHGDTRSIFYRYSHSAHADC
jgi:hypothetical protein